MSYEHLEPLSEIAELSWFDHSLKQLTEWAHKSSKNGFPQPHEVIGRYKFYDPEEVKKWYILYRKATKHMGRGAELNGKRTGS